MRNNEISSVIAPANRLDCFQSGAGWGWEGGRGDREREPRKNLEDSESWECREPKELEFTWWSAREERAADRECQTPADGPPPILGASLLLSTRMWRNFPRLREELSRWIRGHIPSLCRFTNSGNSGRFCFLGLQKSLLMVTAATKLENSCSLEGKLWQT